MLFAVIGGVGLGFFSALHQGSALDIIAMIGAVAGMSIPNFWLGLIY
jgi:peptide/nickel transport system permease protein